MTRKFPNRLLRALVTVLSLFAFTLSTHAAEPNHLTAAYPESLERIDGNWLVWRDGTRMVLDDGKGPKSFTAWLDDPDIKDMLLLPYPAGIGPAEPPPESDPGRARNKDFFDKMYGDCRKGEVKPKLVAIRWLPKKANQQLLVTAVNGVAKRLEAISDELDRLPREFDKYLAPAGGTYNCRLIAGTDRVSAHGYGIAIDIAVSPSDYWRWGGGASGRKSHPIAYRNRIPLEIVHIFERHGFIWGGRWYHYDTMHFEYRPELLPPMVPHEAQAPGPEK
ncbi:M15 family metallopeptidase [Hyphomicrobium sp.]|uniref:M15 family metallopeptidase n=1 Tax=Hyphomicrobium sp. TaxID=82 RepID=UPI002E342477|nr:M15 family metallopeptidase [Hyphomicrobium sp.]HEX2841861.1 M15 family metallopeptidase [Hyphomicrobium sp.]